MLTSLRVLVSRLRAMFLRRRLDEDFDEEAQSHVEMLTEEHLRRGMTPEQARRAAILKFGGLTQIRELHRETRGLPWLDKLGADLRYTFRVLRKSPGFTAVAVLSLGLGIGANTAIFTLIDNLLLKSLPVKNPQELVILGDPGAPDGHGRFSFPTYTELRDRNQVLTGLLARMVWAMSAGDTAVSDWIQGEFVSGNYFSVLGASASLGRTITPEDDLIPGNRVAVLSDGFWRRRYAGDPEVLGRTILIYGQPFTIIGVTPPDFVGIEVGVPLDVRIPLATVAGLGEGNRSFRTDANWEGCRLFGRLRPDVSRQQAEASLAALFRQIRQQQGEALKWNSAERRRRFLERRLALMPGSTGFSGLRRRYRQPLLVSMGAVGLVLLIACANFSSLLLARAAARRREIALRLALGARRRDLARQLLTESTILALGGGIVGVFLAWWCCAAILASLRGLPFAPPVPLRIAPDLRVLGFTLALALLAGIVFGLAPVWQSAGARLVEVLKDQGSSVAGGQTQLSARRVLIVAQVALSVVLLAGAGLLVRTFRNLVNQVYGMGHVLQVMLWHPQFSAYPEARWRPIFRNALERLEALPGVQSATVCGGDAFWPGYLGDVKVEGSQPGGGTQISALAQPATSRYFETLGVKLVRGRMWTAHEDLAPPRHAVVNAAFVRRAFGERDPIGRRIRLAGPPERELEIIGVVRDTKIWELRRETPAVLFHPVVEWTKVQRVYVRTAADPDQMAAAVRRELYSLEPKLGETLAFGLARVTEGELGPDRLAAWLAGIFGLLAALLAAIGLYGVIAYSVARRTREIGVRMALGAGRGHVLSLVLREVLALVGVGVAVGVPAALALTRLARSMLYGVEPHDPATLSGAVLLMAGFAALAGYPPARRAARVDPMVALRCE